MSGEYVDRPDWLIIGQRAPDGGVILLATRDIAGAVHLREEMRVHLDSYTHRPLGATPRIDLHAKLNDYLKVEAATYADALALLLAQWAPDASNPFDALDGKR